MSLVFYMFPPFPKESVHGHKNIAMHKLSNFDIRNQKHIHVITHSLQCTSEIIMNTFRILVTYMHAHMYLHVVLCIYTSITTLTHSTQL